MNSVNKIYLFFISLALDFFLFIVFKSNKIVINGGDNLLNAYHNNRPVVLCSWHCRFLYAIYFMKDSKYKITVISSTHEDSEIMAHVLRRSGFELIRGSSTHGWENVIRKMIENLKINSTIIAITNDGPKGPPKEAKLGSYKIALQSNAQIITISSASTKFWEVKSWDKLRIPKPFGTVYINISKPLNTNEDYKTITNANTLSNYLNENLNELDETI